MNIRQTKQAMWDLGLRPKKFLGQHFLVNTSVVQRIISVVQHLKPTFIVEVGPGLGALTYPLMKLNIPLKVVERDTVLCRYWKNKISVIPGDVLKVPWHIDLPPSSLLIGNLPYQIASRLLVQCSPGPFYLKFMVLMFQREVAERICAVPGTKSYGLLSILSQCFWDIEVLLEVPVQDFYPRPAVAGTVLLLRSVTTKNFSWNNKCIVISPSKKINFVEFVKLCFSKRRKFLINRLKHCIGNHVHSIFHEMKIPFSIRAEELNPEQFLYLFHQLIKNNSAAENE